jgi:hypothetical protein
VISVHTTGSTLTITWSQPMQRVTIELMDATGVVLARTSGTPELHYERSPDNNVIHVVVRASDGNVLAKCSL